MASPRRPVRVSTPDPTLVVMADDRRETRPAGAANGSQIRSPISGCAAHQVPFVAVERRRLGQDRLGDADLADVVEQGASRRPPRGRSRRDPPASAGRPEGSRVGWQWPLRSLGSLASTAFASGRDRGVAPRPSGQGPGASRKALADPAPAARGWRNGLLGKSYRSSGVQPFDHVRRASIRPVEQDDRDGQRAQMLASEATSDLIAVQPGQTRCRAGRGPGHARRRPAVPPRRRRR